MKKINVLYIEDVGEIAGGPNSLLQLFSEIHHDVNIHIFAPKGPFIDKARLFSKNINITNITRYEHIIFLGKRFPNIYHIILRLLDAIKIFKYIKRNKIDIVHSNDLDGHITAWFLNHIFGVQSIWHIRIMTWPRILYKLKRVTKVIFVSKAVMNNALNGLTKNNTTVVYNGIDVNVFQEQLNKFDSQQVRNELQIDKKTFVIGYVGRIKEQKRQKILLEAVSLLINKGFDLKVVFVGDDSVTREFVSGNKNNYYKNLKELAKNYNINKNIIFTGQQSEVAKFYKIFDCFVFPAINDSNPRVILEAMVSRIPIVANNTGGVVDMLENGKFGLISEVDNIQNFSDNIEKVINKKSGIDTEETFLKLNRDFKIEKHKNNILNIYQDILSKRN